MLSLIAILLILSTVSLEAHAGDGGFSALASALGSSKPSGSCSDLMESLLDSGRGAGCDCQCGCKSDSEIDCGCGCCGCQNQGTGCGCGCDCGEQMLHGCEPRPPRECQPFPVIAISQASSITPACFSRASAETRKLVAYVEKLAHEARCTKVCKALDGLMNYAQIYSMLFGRNVNKFSTGRTSCSRPVLRINEAILSSISSMARVAKSLDYQMTVAGNMKCDQASQVITKTVQNYVQLLGVLMSHVTNYLCSTSRIVSNDQILMSVDNIALIFLQLAPSTAEFLKSPSRCSECAYHQSIGAFRKHLEYMSIVARELEGSRSKSLKTALALTEHFLMVMTYEIKLNTSDNHKGYRRMQPHNLDYTHEVATVFKTKDEMLRGIMDRFDSQSGAMTDKEIYREKFTQTILADIQLFEATTKVMSMGDSAQKLAADLHVLTQAAIVEMNTAMSSSTSVSEDEFRLHTDIAQTATEYAVRVLGLIRYAKVEDIQRESGMKYLHDALTTSGATPKHRLLARLAMAKMLKAVVETPSCSGKCMPNDHFAQHKSLMGAMSEAAEKLALSYLNPSETYLPSLNQLTEEFVRDIKFLWDTLYNKRAGLCVNHNCFVIKYGIQVFENAQVLFSKYLTQNRVINQHPVEKVKKLLSSERELLSILSTIPHPLKSEDKKAISSIQQTFQRMLQCPTVGAATAKVRLSTTLAKLSSANTECHTALSNVLRNMELIVNDIISPL